MNGHYAYDEMAMSIGQVVVASQELAQLWEAYEVGLIDAPGEGARKIVELLRAIESGDPDGKVPELVVEYVRLYQQSEQAAAATERIGDDPGFAALMQMWHTTSVVLAILLMTGKRKIPRGRDVS